MRKLIILSIVAISFNSFGQQNGKTEFYDNGQVKVQVTPTGDNTAMVKKFDEQGRLVETGAWENGYKNNTWVSYDADGNIAVIGNFENGVRNGNWLVFDGTGKVKYEIMYDKNRIVNSIDWEKDGAMAVKTTK
jgi:antitoxin component YwqK of YwqJK toxin-antitoxin module